VPASFNVPFRTGDTVLLGRAASVQFAHAPIRLRVTRIHDWTTYEGWLWIDGYELDDAGDAVDQRTLFIQPDGVTVLVPHKRATPTHQRNHHAPGEQHHQQRRNPNTRHR